MKKTPAEAKLSMLEFPGIPDLQVVSFSGCTQKDLQTGKKAVQDKRRHRRFSIADVDICSQMSLARKVRIINISMDGIMLKADRRLDIGNKYTLKIEYKDRTFIAKADVKWSLLVANTEETGCNIAPLYIAGMQFTDISNEDMRDEIMRLIEADSKDSHSLSGRQNRAALPSTNNVTLKESYPNAEGDHSPPDISNCREISGNPPTESSEEIFAKISSDAYRRYRNKNLNYYEILGVDGFARGRETKKAHYSKVREFHSDRYFHLSSNVKERLKQSLKVSNTDVARQEFEKGKLEFWNGCMTEAGKFFQNAIYLDGASARHFFFYAKTLQNLGNLQEAEKAIRNALKIDPSNPDYLVEAGKIYHGLGLKCRAREKFKMALRIQPSNTKALDGLNDLRNKKSAAVR